MHTSFIFEGMLRLDSISLVQFKNYSSRHFQFSDRIIGIYGKNGVGKTNLLDAIHYLCFTKSYFSSSDALNVHEGSKGFRIHGTIMLNDANEDAVCIMRETGKKEFLINDEVYSKFSQHIGRYPCVVVAPDDAVLITGGSEQRRNFLDALLSQIDGEYLKQLISYNKVLQQRNSLLKSAEGNVDEQLLSVFDAQLLQPAQYIFDKRKEFLVGFLPAVKRLYNEIAVDTEDLSIMYESRLFDASYQELLHSSRSKDILLQRTTTGIHRDDLIIQLGKQAFKNIASQGQRKSLLFALKLTELEVIRNVKKFSPILLLDDVFEKLDENRVLNLLQKVCVETDGQVFITDTHEHRLKDHFSVLNINFQLIKP